jgi:hypothetical protein
MLNYQRVTSDTMGCPWRLWRWSKMSKMGMTICGYKAYDQNWRYRSSIGILLGLGWVHELNCINSVNHEADFSQYVV